MKEGSSTGKREINMKRILFTAILAGSIALAGSAMAESKKQLAPGQTGSNPGQTFKTQRESDPDALSPGQQYKLNREQDPNALPPGQGVENYGRSKQLPQP
jgi:hypothetical protein